VLNEIIQITYDCLSSRWSPAAYLIDWITCDIPEERPTAVVASTTFQDFIAESLTFFESLRHHRWPILSSYKLLCEINRRHGKVESHIRAVARTIVRALSIVTSQFVLVLKRRKVQKRYRGVGILMLPAREQGSVSILSVL